MKVAFVLLSLLLLSFTFNYAYAQEPIIMEQVTPNGKMKVQLIWPEVYPDDLYNIELRFLNPENNELVTDRWILYNVGVFQSDDHIEIYTDKYTEDGKGSFEVVFPLEGTGPAEVIVVITAFGIGPTWANWNERVVFDVQVVPEFSTLTIIVLAFSIAAVLALSRFKTKFKP